MSARDPKEAPVAAPYNWKALLDSLPVYSYRDANKSRTVSYHTNLDASDRAALRLSRYSVVGIDTEWKPALKRWETNRIALVQIAGYEECQLHHVYHFASFPPNLRAILENPNVLKVGAGITQDVQKLQTDWGVEVKAYLDLSPLAWEIDPFWGQIYKETRMIALVRLAARYLRRNLDKEQQCSNWENRVLTSPQQTYAANDGCAVLDLYIILTNIHQGYRSLEEFDSPPNTPSSASSSTTLPPYEPLPPAVPPPSSSLQQPRPASTPPKLPVAPSRSKASLPPRSAPPVPPPSVFGPGPQLAPPPIYHTSPPIFHNMYPMRAATYPPPMQSHPQHMPQFGWNPSPYAYVPPPVGPPMYYSQGWIPGPQYSVPNPYHPNPWMAQYPGPYNYHP